jgi:hypothetical protein
VQESGSQSPTPLFNQVEVYTTERSVNFLVIMAGRHLRSKKASESVSSDEFTQYGQAWEIENNSNPESSKLVEQGESAGKIIAENTSDGILDRSNKELETVCEDDDVEIPLGQQVASGGENMQVSTRTGSDTSSTQIPGDLLSVIWQAIQQKEKKDEEKERKDEEYRLERERKDEERERRNEEIRLQDREERQRERAADILKTTDAVTTQFKAELECFNDRILEKLGLETKKLSDTVNSVKEQSQQQIQAVNGRVDGLVESMNDRFV